MNAPRASCMLLTSPRVAAGAPQAQRVVSAMAKPEGPKKGPVGRG